MISRKYIFMAVWWTISGVITGLVVALFLLEASAVLCNARRLLARAPWLARGWVKKFCLISMGNANLLCMDHPCFLLISPRWVKGLWKAKIWSFHKRDTHSSPALAKWMHFKASPCGSIVYICPYKLLSVLAMGNLGVTESLQLLKWEEPKCPLPLDLY